MRGDCLRLFRLLGAVLLVFGLGACAGLAPSSPELSPPSRAVERFVLDGRFSLRQERENHSGRLSWRHADGADELLLSTPFGQGVAEIRVDALGARLTTSDGVVHEAADVETLTDRVLGYPLPLARLTDWVRGRVAPDAQIERDASGRPQRLRYEEWRIEYGYDGDEPEALPSRVFAERLGSFELRLRIDQWREAGAG